MMKMIYDRPSPRLRKELGTDTPSLVIRKKYIPQEGRRPYRLLLKVICTSGQVGWIDP
jgi:hypothetical protein